MMYRILSRGRVSGSSAGERVGQPLTTDARSRHRGVRGVEPPEHVWGETPRGSASEHGFSLVEVSIAMAILAAALIVLLGALVEARRLDRYSNERTKAAGLAQRCYEMILEDARQMDLQQLADTWMQNFTTADNWQFTQLVPPEAGVQTTRTVEGRAYTVKVLFPCSDPTFGQQRLDETVVDSPWGLPRDLDGSGAAENGAVPLESPPPPAPPGAPAMMLPVRVRVEWTGVRGLQRLDFHTYMSRRST